MQEQTNAKFGGGGPVITSVDGAVATWPQSMSNPPKDRHLKGSPKSFEGRSEPTSS